MTYEQDPARWTSSPEEAPELLRGAFSAAQNEGPSQNQMRALALKIAAVSAGGAVAIGATKATATANVAASAATWSIGKLAGVIALAGSLATGAIVWQQQSAKPAPEQSVAKTTAAPSSDQGAAVVAQGAPVVEPGPAQRAESSPALGTTSDVTAQAGGPSMAAPVRPQAGANTSAGAETQPSSTVAATVDLDNRVATGAGKGAQATRNAESARSAVEGARATKRSAGAIKAASGTQAQSETAARRDKTESVAASSSASKITEVELLRRAQLALRSRPREAFRLTQQHRQMYPGGEFAQERDALAIQALIGAGETEMARELAVTFIKAHPTSPHAHRFREAMGIR